MGDISQRLQLHPSRFALPEDRLRRRLRLLWPLAGLWLLYITVLSDHSLLRIWQLSRDNRSMRSSLREMEAEIVRLDRELRDPAAARGRAEHTLRERDGWARPGEIVYRIQPTQGDSAARPEASR